MLEHPLFHTLCFLRNLFLFAPYRFHSHYLQPLRRRHSVHFAPSPLSNVQLRPQSVQHCMGSNLPPNTEAQRDRFNVEIVPGASIDNAFPPHFLRTHFHRGVRLDSAFSRIHGWCGDTCFEDPSKAQDRLMREVIEWFDLDGSDNKWVGQRLRWKSVRELSRNLSNRSAKHDQDAKIK